MHLSPAPPTTQASKRALLVISHAMETAFGESRSSEEAGRSGLVIALFQNRAYFDFEAERYAALAAGGDLVIVGFAGRTDGLPANVHCLPLTYRDPLSAEWALMLVNGGYGTSLLAREVQDQTSGELTLEGSRMFDARWSFLRDEALDDARLLLQRLHPLLRADVHADAVRRLERSSALPISPAEVRLASAANHLVRSVGASHQRAMSLVRALEASRVDAEHDQLTGLKNRRFLERFLRSDARQQDHPVLFIDMDGLKQVNDREGHEAGDAAIVTVARVLREQSHPSGIPVRWGGDEFLLIIAGADVDDGWHVATQIAEAIKDRRPPAPYEHIPLSVSIGVGMTQGGRLPMAQLDGALYEVKRSGKGRVELVGRG